MRRLRQGDVVVTAAWVGAGLHLAGCFASGLPLGHGRYLLPLWPWLALLAGVGAASPSPSSGRIGRVAALLALAGALAVGLSADRNERVERGERAFADGRAAYLLTEHPLGREVLPSRPSAILELIARYPEDRSEGYRLLGRAFVASDRQLWWTMQEALEASAALPEGARAAFLEGVGETVGAVGAAEHGIEDALEAVDLFALRYVSPPRDAAALQTGAALGAMHRELAEGPDRWRALEPPDHDATRDRRCEALGRWSLPLGWTWGPLAGDSWCRPMPFAAGAGRGAARIYPTGAPFGVPQLTWWIGGDAVEPAVQAAFECGFDDEAAVLALLRSADWETAPAPPQPACY